MAVNAPTRSDPLRLFPAFAGRSGLRIPKTVFFRGPKPADGGLLVIAAVEICFPENKRLLLCHPAIAPCHERFATGPKVDTGL